MAGFSHPEESKLNFKNLAAFKSAASASACVLALVAVPLTAFPHGFSGQRFFPATLATDDPFVADEMSLPTFQAIRQPGNPPTKTFDVSWDISKEIFPNLGISIGNGYQFQKANGGSLMTGFDNIGFSVLYQLPKNPEHELVVSLGVTGDIGGTGRKSIGADRFSTFTPTFYFGKGFGDLPDSLCLLRPFAVTGTLGVSFPTSASSRSPDTVDEHPNTLRWGIALEYSIIYLQGYVKDLGIRTPFDRLIPLVEFPMTTPLNRVKGPSPTTGTINPGVIWSGKYFQVGVEAVIPVNQHTGNNVGVLAQLHFYLDDLLPQIFGKPLFGK
jgi:hypothetical protein